MTSPRKVSLAVIVLSAVVMGVLLPGSAAAQPATLRGLVRDTSGKALAGAEVGLVDGRLTVAAGPDGRYEMRGLNSGTLRVFARAVGYRWIAATIQLSPGQDLEHAFTLQPAALSLPDLEVEAKWAKPARLAHTTKYDDFYRRRRVGLGTFLTREDIERSTALRSFELLRGIPGVRVAWNPPGVTGTEVRFARCTAFPPKVSVWIDGQKLIYRAPAPEPGDWGGLKYRSEAWNAWLQLFDVVAPSEIEAMEVYRGVAQIPGEFLDDSCGAVVIWTRDGSRGR